MHSRLVRLGIFPYGMLPYGIGMHCGGFLDASICCMLDLVDPFGGHHKLPLRSWNNILHIILHDGLILLHHGISPSLLVSGLLIIRRIIINDVTHEGHVTRESMRSPSLLERTTGSYVLLFLLQSITKLGWSPLDHCNVSRPIHRLCWLLPLII